MPHRRRSQQLLFLMQQRQQRVLLRQEAAGLRLLQMATLRLQRQTHSPSCLVLKRTTG